MPKSFEYKDSKEQLKYFKNLLQGLNKCSYIVENYKNEVIDLTNSLLKKEYFSKLVEECINGKDVDLHNDNIYKFISNIYFYNESLKTNEICKYVKTSYKDNLESSVKSLSKGKNSITWLFTSKHKKEEAEQAFKDLINLRNDSSIQSVMCAIESLDNLKKTNPETIISDYNDNKLEYRDVFKGVMPKTYENSSWVKIFKECSNKYEKSQKVKDIIDLSIASTRLDVKKSIERMIAENLVNSLREIPVDELARDKSGIKVKYLKDGGFLNLADIFAASAMQIASVYGISQDKAYTIKSKVDSIAENLRKELKIKLSTDDKNKTASKVVTDINTYLKKVELKKEYNELNKEYNPIIKTIYKLFDDIGNGIKLMFMSKEEMQNIRDQFLNLNDNLDNKYVKEIEVINNKLKNLKISKTQAWDEFSLNSIKFYKAIEDICPGVLGNDDSIYGLPEELAREIQDQCYFPDGLLCELRHYQEWGVKYILHQGKVLLGDEMGLGKTIQAIATMVSLKNTGETHFIVVCPASVVNNWCREIVKHSKLRPTKIHGTGKTQAFNSWLKTGGVAVTNYESTSYLKLNNNFKFGLLVVDEAHYIKNTNARRSINTIALSKHTDRLLFMTGTALENKVEEMISLISDLNLKVAVEAKNHAYMFKAPEFRNIIVPVYYRRKREDVLTELPDKIESREWCSLNPKEEKVYEDAILNKHYAEARRVSWNIEDLSESSKAQRLKEIVEDAEDDGRKVLVFSFYLDTITKIHEFLKGKCLNPINGSVNVNRRQEIIDEFDKAPAGTVLLAQITSGGTGLNIQAASVVVICEPQFKPSIENQAISRAYRMGQSRNVLVYRLLCEDTIDEKLTKLLEEKQKTFDAFADKSKAAEVEKTVEIDKNTFGKMINEEIDRINSKRNTTKTSNIDKNISNEDEVKTSSILLDKFDYNPINVEETGIEYYKKIMKMSYKELVQFLLNKYGPAKYDYFSTETSITKNKKVTRTDEGLYCHHIDEDKAILLSKDEFASQNPFEYQKADRLVYCNLLEHFLLHILIAEEPKNKDANQSEIQGIGGAVCMMCRQLNDLYNGYQYKQQWMINTTNVVKNDYDSYILMLKRLWNLIKNNYIYSCIITKEMLAMGWENNVYESILKEFS